MAKRHRVFVQGCVIALSTVVVGGCTGGGGGDVAPPRVDPPVDPVPPMPRTTSPAVSGGSLLVMRDGKTALAADEAVQMLVAGRTPARAKTFAAGLKGAHAPEAHALDINGDVAAGLARIRPDIVVDATGPFQGRDHRVAAACIEAGCHYLDIADGRDFVAGIGALDAAARAQGASPFDR